MDVPALADEFSLPLIFSFIPFSIQALHFGEGDLSLSFKC